MCLALSIMLSAYTSESTDYKEVRHGFYIKMVISEVGYSWAVVFGEGTSQLSFMTRQYKEEAE